MSDNNVNPKNKISLDLENQPDSILLIQDSSIKVEVLIRKMIHAFSTEGFKHLMSLISSIANLYYGGGNWFNLGVPCELLEPGKGWKKGTVKVNIQLEFIPDEPELEINKSESPLEDIRQSMN